MTSGERTASVRVPATSANLGAGFDCIGIAVDRWLSASVETGDNPRSDDAAITISRDGTLASLTLPPEEDLLVAGFAAAARAGGRPVPKRLAFVVNSEIPVARGLGSSSAALVAGASLADAALSLRLGQARLAELCADIEGHPDNVAPAVFGGAMLAVPANGSGEPRRWVFAQLPVHPGLAFIFVIPSYSIETALARAILPREVAHEVAVRAAGKGAALAHGLATGDGALLKIAFDDVLHVPYRRELVSGIESLHDAACAAGAYGVTLSGSGPTLVAVAPHEAAERIADAMRKRWSIEGVEADSFVQRQPAIV
ncbi:MAG TPA: homoserine kinase [Gemmatimonadaceae bacterium]